MGVIILSSLEDMISEVDRIEFHDKNGDVQYVNSGIESLKLVFNHGEMKMVDGDLEDHIPQGQYCYDNDYKPCPFYQGDYCAYHDEEDLLLGDQVKICDKSKNEKEQALDNLVEQAQELDSYDYPDDV